MSARHRHERSSWVIAFGKVEWCYQCGAWRYLLRPIPPTGGYEPASKWQRPTGIGGRNPAVKGAK